MDAGWTVSARSWAAALVDIDRQRLRERAARAREVTVRELRKDDVGAALTLDAQTREDYPGDVATQHEPLNEQSAVPTPTRRGFGAFTRADVLTGVEILADLPTQVHDASGDDCLA